MLPDALGSHAAVSTARKPWWPSKSSVSRAPGKRRQEKEEYMIVFARGSVTDPDAVGPYVEEEMRVLGELKSEGVVQAAYRRASGPGVYLILEGSSVNAVQERLDSLPFVVEGLMALEYEEIYEI
jgi:hypothetical protein